MKAILVTLIVASTILLNHKASAQTNEQITGHYYTSVYAQYNYTKQGITSEIEMTIGEDPTHPFAGQVKVIDHEAVHINDGQINHVFKNEQDLMGYLKREGWNMVSSSRIEIMSKDYMQYVFYKEGR